MTARAWAESGSSQIQASAGAGAAPLSTSGLGKMACKRRSIAARLARRPSVADGIGRS
jgi:hypothetical protein